MPNTTPTPNWLYNGEMRKMNETELKVILLVTRKTLGWFDPATQERKQQDYISQKQFMEFTGQSHTAIAKAIQGAVKVGWIIAKDRNGNLCDSPEKRRRRKVWYQLGSVFTKKISKQQSCLDENLSNNLAKSKQQSCIHLSNNVDNTKVTLTKEIIQTSVIKDDSYSFPLNEMLKSKQFHIQIIGIYWKWLDWNFDNKEQYQSAVKRDLRTASALKGYSLDRIKRTFKYLDEQSDNGKKFNWNLGTVHKYIDGVK